jgi:hypothetical protein
MRCNMYWTLINAKNLKLKEKDLMKIFIQQMIVIILTVYILVPKSLQADIIITNKTGDLITVRPFFIGKPCNNAPCPDDIEINKNSNGLIKTKQRTLKRMMVINKKTKTTNFLSFATTDTIQNEQPHHIEYDGTLHMIN